MLSASPLLNAALGDLAASAIIPGGYGHTLINAGAASSSLSHIYHSPPAVEPTYLQSGGGGSQLETAPFALEDTFFLHSLPGATKTIYLDFDGHLTQNTPWNNVGPPTILSPAFDMDGNVNTNFSDFELIVIQEIWERVAEDFRPFEVNVTTQDPGVEALRNTGFDPNTGLVDQAWGQRVVITSLNWYTPATGIVAGGVAHGSFGSSIDDPCFVFNIDNVVSAETISHEVGHTMGLAHDGQFVFWADITDPADVEWHTEEIEYYNGHGIGETGWGTIMGTPFPYAGAPFTTFRDLTQWSNGVYANANNIQDDLAIITTSNGFGYRPDDHGSTIGSASQLTLSPDQILFSNEGIIEQNTDIDYFSFVVGGIGESVILDISPFHVGPNLDILAKIHNSVGTEIYRSNPLDGISAGSQTFGAFADGGWAKIVNGEIAKDANGIPIYETELFLLPGTYYVSVDGTGRPITFVDPAIPARIADPPNPFKPLEHLPADTSDWGYSDYGSLGYYAISGRFKSLVVGVDFDVNGGTTPLNWNLFAGGAQETVLSEQIGGPLISETGAAVPYELTISTTGTSVATSASDNPIAPGDLPEHARPLDDLDGYLSTATSTETLTFKWSNLEPSAVYQIYVFGHASFDAENVVTITGGEWNGEAVQTFNFTQSVAADGLVVNNDDSPGGDVLSTLSYLVVATESGEITITVTTVAGDKVGLAGLAIAPTRLGSISGQKWNDLDGNGNRGPGEEGLPGWTIYLDLNNDGLLNFTEDQTVTATNNVSQPIPDASVVGVKSELNIEEHGKILDVNVTLNITHPFAADVHAYLISPLGTQVELFTDVGGFGQNFTNTTLDDQASQSITAVAAPFTGSFRPEKPLSAFNDQEVNGVWTLLLRDTATDDVGTLLNWTLTFSLAGVFIEPFATTDDSGNYTFQNLKPGEYIVREHPSEEQLLEGWRPTPTQKLGIPPVTVRSFAHVTGVDFGNWIPVSFPGSIAGQKWHDIDGNGEKDSEEPGLANWIIYIDSNNNGVRDLAGPPITIESTDVPKPISENLPLTTSQITFDGVGTILSVEVTLDISHSFMGDLNAYLTSPTGTIVELFSDVGGQYNDFQNLTFADDADRSITTLSPADVPYTGRWRPEGRLLDFFGEQLTNLSPWTLTIQDTDFDDQGFLNSWSLKITVGELSTTTDQDGNYSFKELPVGLYIVREEMQPNWSQTYAPPIVVDQATRNSYNVEVFPNQETVANFGNQLDPGLIQGKKWNDLNNNGEIDDGEPGLEGWTIYIDADDDGQLDLDILQTVNSENVPVTISDGSETSPTTVTSELTFSGVSSILDLNVALDITHTFAQDLIVRLVSPSGTTVELFNAIGSDGDDFQTTVLDDEATTSITDAAAPFNGTFRPTGSLSDFDGENPNGVWRLEVTDTRAGDTGTINGWSITITSSEQLTTTDVNGNYSFTGLEAGSYIIREVPQAGWHQVYPDPAIDPAHRVTLVLGQHVTANFGNRPGPAVPGDYTRDGNVDAADYVLWRHTIQHTVEFPYDGADGNGSSEIETADYTPWAANFGHAADDHGNAAIVATNVNVPVVRAGLIESFGDVDWFRFRAITGRTYTLETILGSLQDSVLRLIDVNGTTVLETNDNSVGLESLIEWTAPATGFYYAEVRAAGALQLGSYDFSISVEAVADDHGNDAFGATAVAVPSTTNGLIETFDDVDWFSFTATEGTTYDIRTILDTLEDSILRVYGTNGTTQLAFNDDDPNGIDRESFIRWTAPANGTYYVEVSALDFGTYQVSIEESTITDDHGNDSASATAVLIPSTTAGDIETDGDDDWFSFTATSGTQYTIRTILGTLEDSELFLYATDGTTQLAYNDDDPGGGFESRISWIAPATGTYYVRVRSLDNLDTGTYDLSISTGGGGGGDDHGNTSASATAIAVPSTTNGELEDFNDFDFFSFSATAGTRYKFQVTLNSLVVSYQELIDTDGSTQLRYSFDEDIILFTAPVTATYYFAVEQYFDETGTYSVSVSIDTSADDHGDIASAATAIATTSTTTGELEVEGDVDWFKFDAISGTEYHFKIVFDTLTDSKMRLIGTDGITELAYDDTIGGAVIDWTAPGNGTYYIEVSGYFSNDVGTYELQASVSGGGGGGSSFEDEPLQLFAMSSASRVTDSESAAVFGDESVGVVDYPVVASSGRATRSGGSANAARQTELQASNDAALIAWLSNAPERRPSATSDQSLANAEEDSDADLFDGGCEGLDAAFELLGA